MPNSMKMHYSVSLKIVHNFYESERRKFTSLICDSSFFIVLLYDCISTKFLKRRKRTKNVCFVRFSIELTQVCDESEGQTEQNN